MSKIFIVSLPRTGTTSICYTLLLRGFKVAHTAYTKKSFESAQVIADTPVYCDYTFLDKSYPGSKYIYLERDTTEWAASMQLLLVKIHEKIKSKGSGYHPILERCIKQLFGQAPLTLDALIEKHEAHKQQLLYFFSSRDRDFLSINISQKSAYSYLCEFIGIADDNGTFPQLNKNGRVFEWQKIKHPLKVGSHERENGQREYFCDKYQRD